MINFSCIIPIYTTFASRLHGGGFINGVNRQLRNAIFALPYLIHHLSVWGSITPITAFVFAFIGINAGHDEFWEMGTGPNEQKNNWLTAIVTKLGFKRDSLPWCWAGLGIKGALIGLGTLNPLTIILSALAFPTAYYIGFRTKWTNVTAEFLSGFLLGLALIA